MTNPKTPWDLDIRVRERNLKKGVLEEKEVQNYLKELPDLAAHAEIVSLPQPAIAGSAATVATAAPLPVAAVPTPAPSSNVS